MSNLRSLLGTESTTMTGIYSGGVGRLGAGQQYYFYQAWSCQTCSDIECSVCAVGLSTDARGCPATPGTGSVETMHYNAYIYCCWKPPYGTTRIDFELWGAGGGGATACCCAIGVPGGAGAYSRMTVRTGLGSVTAGIGSDWHYTIYYPYRTCLGGTCGGPTCTTSGPRPYSYGACQDGDIPGITTQRGPVQGVGGQTGYAGSDAWAVGCGLENFCAQGGVPGCAFCNLEFGHWITGFNSMTVSAASTISGPGNDIVGFNTSCIGCCAMYYGCSGSGAGINTACGAPGMPGAISHLCNGSCRHWNKFWIPYPGGLVNQCGGHIEMQNCGNECCFCRMHDWAASKVGFGALGRSGDGTGYVPGFGAPSAMVNGGACCCGSTGNPGAARITVYFD